MSDVTIDWEGPFTIEEVLTMNDQHDAIGCYRLVSSIEK